MLFVNASTSAYIPYPCNDPLVKLASTLYGRDNRGENWWGNLLRIS